MNSISREVVFWIMAFHCELLLAVIPVCSGFFYKKSIGEFDWFIAIWDFLGYTVVFAFPIYIFSSIIIKDFFY